MVHTTREQDVTVIELGPSYATLDHAALQEMKALLLSQAATADPPRLVVDLSGTDYIGTTFVELLVRTWKRLRERGGKMALCGLHPFCAEVLQVSRVDTLWKSFPGRDQAIAALSD